MKDSENIIVNLSFDFALAIIEYCEILEHNKRYVIANQLLKSGTLIGANIREAQNAESKNDFIHKFKIAAKEVEETIYWLELCSMSKNFPDCSSLNNQIQIISKIINKIIISSKNK